MTTENKELRGFDRLHDRTLTKGTAFGEAERDHFGLRGLLPPQVLSMQHQTARLLENLRRKQSNIEKYVFLSALQNRNERLFYRLVIDHMSEIMPLIYTPTVGQACKEFAHIFQEPHGLYVSAHDRGRVAELVANWPEDEVSTLVVTDGGRILGLGDLGANGMGIPIGKLSLYTACAGVHPSRCLPVMLDVGTSNSELKEDPLYLGLRQPRIDSAAYETLVDEFIQAVLQRWPRVLIQFEDFATPNAYRFLARYRDNILCFNDDIQGTAAVALAGLLAASRAIQRPLSEMKILFLGAGSAATGIAHLILKAMQLEGLSQDQARAQVWLVDHEGLIVSGRENLADHKRDFAQDRAATDFRGALEALQPHVLIGATGTPNTFTQELISRMAEFNERPIISALSNPTSRAECTAEQAYHWTQGRVLFASGSPFDPVHYGDRVYRPAQGNNAYIFPGVGLGAQACRASRISDDMFLAAARALAGLVSPEDLEDGALYPPLDNIRDVSLAIADAVAEQAWSSGLAQCERPSDPWLQIEKEMYDPRY